MSNTSVMSHNQMVQVEVQFDDPYMVAVSDEEDASCELFDGNWLTSNIEDIRNELVEEVEGNLEFVQVFIEPFETNGEESPQQIADLLNFMHAIRERDACDILAAYQDAFGIVPDVSMTTVDDFLGTFIGRFEDQEEFLASYAPSASVYNGFEEMIRGGEIATADLGGLLYVFHNV